MSGSSKAWTWRHAFASSSLPATTKAVLHTLGMFMNEFGEGCYPTIADICRYSGFDKKTVMKHLASARDAGWIAVSLHGYRGQKWKRQEYAARWPERDLVAACPPADDERGGGAVPPPSEASKVVDFVPEGGGIEGIKVVEQVHQDKTSPVNIPNTPPSERARECEKETRKAIEEAYWKLVYGWPGLAGQPQEKWLKAWFALTPEERIEAAAKRDAWIDLLKSNGHHKVHRPGTYFEGKLWKQVPDQSAEAGRKPTRIEARPFSNPFMVEVYRNFLLVEPVAPSPITKIEALLVEQGRRTAAEIQWDKRRENGWPAVNDMFERARGWRSSVVSASLTAVFPFLVPVLVGGEMWDAWKAFHQEQGWQWFPPTGKLQYVHFPAGGPDGLKDFEAALRGLGENDGN